MSHELKRDVMSDIRAVEGALRRWDPIGILPGEDGPAGEYDSYAPHIVTLVARGYAATDLAEYLGKLRSDIFGSPEDQAADSRAAESIIGALRSKDLQRD